jgi:hypothetical protein
MPVSYTAHIIYRRGSLCSSPLQLTKLLLTRVPKRARILCTDPRLLIKGGRDMASCHEMKLGFA